MDDTQIIDLYWDRDQGAITATAGKYGSFLHALSWNILRSHHDAEECVNDTYFRAWNAIPPERPGALRAWLGRITRNLSLDRWKAGRTQSRGAGMETLLGELDECIPDHRGPEQAAEERVLAECVSAFLRGQTADNRYIFLRRYWYGEDIAAIAKRLDCGESRVKSALFRTRKALRAPAKKRPVWRRYAAAAACLMVLCGAGAAYLVTGGFRGHGASAGGSGINNADSAADTAVFMSYAGPVLPLTTADENPGVTAERHTDWDFTPRTDPEGYDSQWGAAITDGYILGNPTDTDVTLTLLYPIVGGIKDLLSIDPGLTVNGEKAEKELVIGDYAGGFGGAGGGDTSTLNLRYPSQWTDYQTLLDGTVSGGYPGGDVYGG